MTNHQDNSGQAELVLWATKVGEPDWAEQLITSGNAEKVAKARSWAEANGFDRLRVSTFNWEKPDFVQAIGR